MITTDSSVKDFLAHASSLLYAREAENSLMLGLAESAYFGNETVQPLLIRIVENGKTVGAATQLPPNNLVLSHARPGQIEMLVRYLMGTGANIPGVVGPARESEEFAQLWSSLAACNKRLAMGQKIYVLERVKPPVNVPGELRESTAEDLDLLAQWFKEFGEEALPGEPRTLPEWRDYASRSVQQGYAHVWTVDGEPVSMAQVSRPTRNGVSVNGVYTPAHQRRKGYASAAVAALSQKWLDRGKKFCVLYTDLANPTSNKIYQDVGYREAADSKYFSFL